MLYIYIYIYSYGLLGPVWALRPLAAPPDARPVSAIGAWSAATVEIVRAVIARCGRKQQQKINSAASACSDTSTGRLAVLVYRGIPCQIVSRHFRASWPT